MSFKVPWRYTFVAYFFNTLFYNLYTIPFHFYCPTISLV